MGMVFVMEKEVLPSRAWLVGLMMQAVMRVSLGLVTTIVNFFKFFFKRGAGHLSAPGWKPVLMLAVMVLKRELTSTLPSPTPSIAHCDLVGQRSH